MIKLFLLLNMFHYNSYQKSYIGIINKSNVKFKHIVVTQAIEESAWFTSNRARNCNNIFGIKFVKHKSQSRCYRKYGCYNTIEDCVKHFEIIQRRAIVKYRIKTNAQYYHYLRTHYAENKKYVSNLKSIHKKVYGM